MSHENVAKAVSLSRARFRNFTGGNINIKYVNPECCILYTYILSCTLYNYCLSSLYLTTMHLDTWLIIIFVIANCIGSSSASHSKRYNNGNKRLIQTKKLESVMMMNKSFHPINKCISYLYAEKTGGSHAISDTFVIELINTVYYSKIFLCLSIIIKISLYIKFMKVWILF